tara:strand:+ start:44 stop:361 length:318 start_codon:yes stop_codon:yes gene_type:complete
MPTNAGYNKMFKAGKGNGEGNLSGARALVKALAKKGIKARNGLETSLLNKMTKGGGVDVVGMMTEGPSSDMAMMKPGGEKYNYGRGGSYGQASTYSGKKKKKRKK